MLFRSVNVLHRKIRVNDGFGVSKVVTSKLQTRNVENVKKFEDVELQALLNDGDSQTQNNSASNWTLVNKLFPIGYERWERFGRAVDGWVPHELNDSQMEKRKNTCHILLTRYKRKLFLHRITIRWQGMKS